MCITCSLLNNQTNDKKKSFLASLIINALNNQQIENNHLILAFAIQKADIFSA